MPIYFIDESAVRPPVIAIQGQLARHLAGALRIQPGEQCRFIDAQERRYLGEVTSVTPATIIATILKEEPPAPPLRPVTLAQSILKGHRMDWLLQKATELGATRIVPLITTRTIVRPKRERWPAQEQRWAAILREASQQSGRNRPPELAHPCDLRTALTGAPAETLRLTTHKMVLDNEYSAGAPWVTSVPSGPHMFAKYGGIFAAELLVAYELKKPHDWLPGDKVIRKLWWVPPAALTVIHIKNGIRSMRTTGPGGCTSPDQCEGQ